MSRRSWSCYHNRGKSLSVILCHECRHTLLLIQAYLCSYLTLGNPKSYFLTLLSIYLRLFPFAQKKTSSNCCSAALAVYLLLFSASYFLHSPYYCVWGTLQEERVYWYGHLEACSSGLLRHGLNFSTAWCTTWLNSVEKRLEACINAERGHSEHLLWHCLPDIAVATHHNRFFSELPMTTHNWLFSGPKTSEKTQQTLSHMKKFSNLQVNVVTFSDGVSKRITL